MEPETVSTDGEVLLPPAARLRAAAARRLGYRLEVLDPETRCLLVLSDGRRSRVLVAGPSPLNDAGATRLAGDKFYAAQVLRRAGFRVPTGVRCLLEGTYEKASYPQQLGLGPARRFAQKQGFPLVVKPNRGARGRDVAAVEDLEELEGAIRRVWHREPLALVQECIEGFDLRLDFLEGEFLLGYRRRPVVLVGDGVSSLGELLEAWDPSFSGPRFEARLVSDPFWQRRVTGWGLELASVLPVDRKIALTGQILNLARFCVASLIEDLPQPWLEYCLSIGRALHLRHFGLDLRVPGTPEELPQDPTGAVILEVNASPGLGQVFHRGAGDPVIGAEMRVLRAILKTTESGGKA